MRKPEPMARGAFAPIVRRQPLAAFDPAPSPLTTPLTDNPQESVMQDLNDLQRGFRERKAAEDARFKLATDADYYCVVAFETGAQCDKFLEHFGIGRGEDSLFIDGRLMADRLGIELPEADLKLRDKQDKKLSALVRREK